MPAIIKPTMINACATIKALKLFLMATMAPINTNIKIVIGVSVSVNTAGLDAEASKPERRSTTILD
jgi:hypothetical protein